jgi:hypothetical protein
VNVLIATGDGVVGLPGLEGRDVGAIATSSRDDATVWALVDGAEVWRHERPTGWFRAASTDDGSPALTCLAVARDGDGVLVGTTGAHLARVVDGSGGGGGGGRIEVDGEFDALADRQRWYTPWGDPPDTRSIAVDPDDGSPLVNIHVGGVARRTPGDGWRALVDIDVDVHQVLVAPDGSYLVATGAAGFGRSTDHGRTWRWDADGMHGSYCRAVAVTGGGDQVLVSASEGPHQATGAVYRRPLGSDGAWQRVTPMVDGNVDTAWLAGDTGGTSAAFVTQDGVLFVSTDAGATWDEAGPTPAPPRALAFA